MTRMVLVVCLLLSGCSAGPETFWRGVTRGICKYNRKRADSQEPLVECERLAYEDAGRPEDFAATCGDYDRESARACLRYVRSSPRMCGGLSERPTSCEGVCGPGSAIVFYPEDSGWLTEVTVDPGPRRPVLIAE
ncbi:hypothetical protein OV203_27720 [Nannocystis sp. ILAH1]|uniref:hypothetical protein n=1 Tax=Nannocystis sp. ILAH1 TaxID=2996789 RepID=UPI00226D558D|nr:hypothetical protein [Nannocystis sp. ILAH1]MCY0990964.1 hypothetical protein [Nannocystis sp. ILAH1]